MIKRNELQRPKKLQCHVKPARRRTMPTSFAETKAKSSGMEVSATDHPTKRVNAGALARVLIAAAILGICAVPRSGAQNLCATTASEKVGCAVANVFGPAGLTTNGNVLVAHTFPGSGSASPNSFILNVTALSAAVGGQLGELPLVSPASGIAFSFDKSLGVFVPSEYNFGPVLSERAGTIGRHKILFGFAYQAFDFDKLDGVDLKNLHAAFAQAPLGTCSPLGGAGPQNESGCAFIRDTLVTTNNIDLRVNQYTTFVSFGLTSRLDVSVAIPIVNVRMAVTSNASIHNNGLDDGFQFVAFPNGPACASACFNRTFFNASGASGIGDITLRAKYNIWKGEKAGLAVGTDVRLPTGDSLNYLGSGAYGIKPFGAFSTNINRFSAHLNAGYEWNGQSFLAGNIAPAPDPVTGVTPASSKASLPSQFFYTAGGEVGIFKRLSGAVDFLGAHYFNAPRIQATTFTELPACDPTKVNSVPTPVCNPGQFTTNSTVDANIQQIKAGYSTEDLAVGLRFRPFGKLLLTANGIVKLNDAGLRSKFVPLLGISYSH
jgi:hypothetical protein